jgi:L-ascorbate metabolism protein UlaG (beta-lactamase superfamily)
MPLPPVTPAPVVITYVGGPTAVIDVGGFRLLTDPTFDAPQAYTSGPVRVEKTEGPAIDVGSIGPIDVILLSHDQHSDNLDRAGRALVARIPTLTTEAGASRLGGPAVGLAPWASRELTTAEGRRLRVTATPARHGPAGIEPILGDVVGFVLSSVEPAADLVYVTGDTASTSAHAASTIRS